MNTADVGLNMASCNPRYLHCTSPFQHHEGGRGIAQRILHLGVRWVAAITPRPLEHRLLPENNPGTHWRWGWVGLRASLDVLERRKISFPCRDSNPGPSSP